MLTLLTDESDTRKVNEVVDGVEKREDGPVTGLTREDGDELGIGCGILQSTTIDNQGRAISIFEDTLKKMTFPAALWPVDKRNC